MPVAKTCAVCSKEFSVPPGRAETAITCSRTCKGILTAKSYQEQRVSHRCKWCDKEFFSPKSHASRRVFCSTVCKGRYETTFHAGPVTPDGELTMHSAGYVLERSRAHPFAVSGVVMQHRLVMERWMRETVPDHPFLVKIGLEKYLRREIHVHHRNEIKADNDRSNLLACTAATHLDVHAGRPVMRGTAWPETGEEIDSEKRTMTRNCLICGIGFKAKLSTILRGSGKYCSKSCSAKSRAGLPRKPRKTNSTT